MIEFTIFKTPLILCLVLIASNLNAMNTPSKIFTNNRLGSKVNFRALNKALMPQYKGEKKNVTSGSLGIVTPKTNFTLVDEKLTKALLVGNLDAAKEAMLELRGELKKVNTNVFSLHALLPLALEKEFWEVAEELINAGADLNTVMVLDENRNVAPLIFIYAGRPKVLAFLISHGADIFIKDKAGRRICEYIFSDQDIILAHMETKNPVALDMLYLYGADRFIGEQVLEKSIETYIINMGWWEFLEQRGDRISVYGSEKEAIFMLQAMRTKNKAKLERMVKENMMNLNRINPYIGHSWLHEAVMIGESDIVEMLIKLGADPYALCYESNLTPAQLAEKVENPKLAKLLEARMWKIALEIE